MHRAREHEPMSVLLLTIAAVCVAVAAFLVRRRGAPGALALIVLLLGVAQWNATYGIEIGVEGLGAKLFWAQASYLGIVVVPIALLAFAADYSGRRAWLTPRRFAMLAVVPAITLVLALTQEAHGLLWSAVGPAAPIGRPLHLEHGPAFYAGWLYAQGIVIAASVLLLSGVSFGPFFRRQSLALIVSLAMPWAANLAYVVGLAPGGFDLTTLGFAATSLALAIAGTRWGLLDIAPVAREAIVEHMRPGMVVVDARGRIVDCNRGMQPLLACAAPDAIGRHARDVLPEGFAWLWSESELPAGRALPVVERHERDGFRAFEPELVDLGGRGARGGRLLLLHDVTAREQLQARLTDQALTDELTQIGNRRYLLSCIERALLGAARSRRSLGVIFIDLDDFKVVNDTYGHRCGDAVLVATARRLEQTIRPGDSVARLGGDEFAILLPEVDAWAVDEVADRIAAELRLPVPIDGQALLSVPASIGVHVTDGAGCTAESLLNAADRQMYEAKRSSRADTGRLAL